MSKSWVTYGWYILLAIVLVGLDQVTKQVAFQQLVGQPPVPVLPIFQFALVLNEGAAFGFLNDAGGWQQTFFIALALVFSVVLLVWIRSEQDRNKWLTFALACVLGGAIGNLIDRVNAGFVIDFLVLHYQDWYFPAFNIADIAITVGATMLIIDALFRGDGKAK